MASSYSVEWSSAAKREFYQVLHYWASRNSSASYPRKLLRLVDLATQHLQRNPLFMQERLIKGEVYRSYLVDKNYSLIYRVAGARVQILMFWSNARNLK